MIHRVGYPDADGWLHRTHIGEGPPPTGAVVPLTADECHVAGHLPGSVRHGPDGLELAQDDPTAWKVLRHRHPHHPTGTDAAGALETLRDFRHLFKPLTVVVEHPPPVMAPGAPLGPAFPDVPGLTLEPITTAHLDEIAQIAAAAELYDATCPPTCGRCVPPEAHAWMQMAARLDHWDSWQLALCFNGQPLQYEIIGFDHHRGRAVFNITFHANRERPAWFWREASQPVFAAMARIGIRQVESRTRADRPDWIASLKENYGAVEYGTAPNGRGEVMHLGFPLDLSRFQGWPARRVLGFDRTVGALRVWEATDADLPALREVAAQVPAPRRAIALRMLEERWHLDRAAILLGAVDGALKHARAIRLRRGTAAGLTNLSALAAPGQEALPGLLADWCRQAGYTELGTYVPTRLLEQADQKSDLGRLGMTARGTERTFDGEPHTEMVVPL